MIIFLAVREKTTVQSKQPSKVTAPDHFNLLRRQCMLAMYTNYEITILT